MGFLPIKFHRIVIAYFVVKVFCSWSFLNFYSYTKFECILARENQKIWMIYKMSVSSESGSPPPPIPSLFHFFFSLLNRAVICKHIQILWANYSMAVTWRISLPGNKQTSRKQKTRERNLSLYHALFLTGSRRLLDWAVGLNYLHFLSHCKHRLPSPVQAVWNACGNSFPFPDISWFLFFFFPAGPWCLHTEPPVPNAPAHSQGECRVVVFGTESPRHHREPP